MGIQTLKLYVQGESPSAVRLIRAPWSILETDITVKIDPKRTGNHWLLHLLNRGLIKPGEHFQLRTLGNKDWSNGWVVKEGVVEVTK